MSEHYNAFTMKGDETNHDVFLFFLWPWLIISGERERAWPDASPEYTSLHGEDVSHGFNRTPYSSYTKCMHYIVSSVAGSQLQQQRQENSIEATEAATANNKQQPELKSG